MIERPSWDEYFLQIAKCVAARSSCLRASVGAVIVSQDHRMLSTGYNGSVPGEPHCTDVGVGCLVVDGHCQRTLHAEVNAIAWAAKVGVALDGALMYVHMSTKAGNKAPEVPCRECAKVMKAANVVMGKVFWEVRITRKEQ